MGAEQDAAAEPIFLPARLMESCEDDIALAHEVLNDFLASAPRALSRLTAAVAEGDCVLIRLTAHSLKGISRTIGAEALAGVSARLETASAGGNLLDAPRQLAEVGQWMHRLNEVLTVYLAP